MSKTEAHAADRGHCTVPAAARAGTLQRMTLTVLLASALWAASAHAQSLFGLGGEPPPPVEPVVPAQLPALEASAMLEFFVSPTTTNRFAIDTSSIAIDQARLVRFSLLVTSRSGARNVSYEAIRCDRRDRRLLALGRADGSWSMIADSPWRPISANDSVNRHHMELFTKLCAGGAVAGQQPAALRDRLLDKPTVGP